MGQHLHLYASRDVPIEAADAWCSARATGIVRSPSSVEAGWLREYADEIRLAEHYEDGLCRCLLFPFLVWEAHVVNRELISRAEAVDPGGQVAAFLRAHLWWTVWGDNDGV